VRNRFALVLTVTLAFALLLPTLPTAQAQDAEDNVIRLGYIPVVIYAPIYVGVERGYFEEEGVRVELIPVPAGGGDSIIQLAAGNFDAAATGAGATLLNAAYQGLGFRIVAPLHTERPPLSTPLVIAANRVDELRSISDLRGKKIAINTTGSAIEYWVYKALESGGLTMHDVTIVSMPFPQMPPALEAGAIDAGVMTDPLPTLAREQGTIAYLADDFIDGQTVTYVFFGMPLIEERPAMAEAFMRGYLRAARDLQGDGWLDRSTAEIIEKYTQVPADVVLRMNRPYFDPNGTVPLADLEEIQRYFLTRGVLEYTEPLDMAAYVDTSFVDKALEALGVYPEPTPEPTAED
jgi:NitT/TauT family transport system substrate-binding protein